MIVRNVREPFSGLLIAHTCNGIRELLQHASKLRTLIVPSNLIALLRPWSEERVRLLQAVYWLTTHTGHQLALRLSNRDDAGP